MQVLYKSFPNIGRDGKLSDTCNKTCMVLTSDFVLVAQTQKESYQRPKGRVAMSGGICSCHNLAKEGFLHRHLVGRVQACCKHSPENKTATHKQRITCLKVSVISELRACSLKANYGCL